MTFWEQPHFKALQKQWYAKLKASGFDDLEPPGASELLPSNAERAYQRAPKVLRETRLTYFAALERCVATASFDCPADRLILTRHAEGAKFAAISRELRAKGKKCHRQTIRYVIRRYENRWGLRTWREDQMSSAKIETTAETPSSYTVVAYHRVAAAYRSLIFSKWLHGLRFGNDFFKLIDQDAYFETYRRVIENILASPQVVVRLAVLTDDEDVVLGFSVARGSTLDFVYVGRDFRRQGIARALVPPVVDTITHLTKPGMAIWAKTSGVKFNPFA